MDKPSKGGSGYFLSSILCDIKLPQVGDELKTSNKNFILRHPVVQRYLFEHDDKEIHHQIFSLHPAMCLENVLEEIRHGKSQEELHNNKDLKFFLNNIGICLSIVKTKNIPPKFLNQVVKLPDILSSVDRGNFSNPERWVKAILWNLLFSLYIHVVSSDAHLSIDIRPLQTCIGFSMVNYGFYEDPLTEFTRSLCQMSQNEDIAKVVRDLATSMPQIHLETFLKRLLPCVSSGLSLIPVFQTVPQSILTPAVTKILLARGSFQRFDGFLNAICFLRQFLNQEHFFHEVFVPVLALWADPVIARAYVKAEVVHYSKLVFLMFSHLSRDSVLHFQLDLVQELSRGLPNHFSSTDPRTVSLANFLVELITESIKFLEKRTEKVPEELTSPVEPLCQEILDSFHVCPATSDFWYTKFFNARSLPISDETPTTDTSRAKPESTDTIDEDDDSDLEPIDTLDAPASSGVVYIRDFLDQLPEMKSYDDTVSAFRKLPSIVRHQLELEHPQVGRDLIDVVFDFENSFESPEIDDLKRRNLSTALESKLEGNLEHFCSIFNRPSLQAYKKNVVLDVLTHVAESVSLSRLEYLAKVTFRDMLTDGGAIDRLETINKIPAVLYFQRVLCLLPVQMVREEMVVSYLSALSGMKALDSGLVQTVQYALHSIMRRLEGVPLTKDIHDSIVNTRVWLMAIDN